jgi:hypothetical protein
VGGKPEVTAMFMKSGWTGAALALALAGCATTTTEEGQPRTAPHEAAHGDKADGGRDAYLKQTHAELARLDREAAALEASLVYEAEVVPEADRDAWHKQLRHFRKHRQEATRRILRASLAADDEWEDMRADVDAALALVSVDLDGLRDRQTVLVKAYMSEAGADVGLCPIDLANGRVGVEKEQLRVIVTARTTDAKQARELQRRARKIAADGTYASTMQEERRSIGLGVPVTVSFVDLRDGIRIVITPKNRKDVDRLKAQLDADKKTLLHGACEGDAPQMITSG